MNIICEFCGHSIDVNKEDCCENCGASYVDNKQFIEYKRRERENKRLNEIKEQRNHTRRPREQIKLDPKLVQVIKTIAIIYALVAYVLPIVIGLIVFVVSFIAELLMIL